MKVQHPRENFIHPTAILDGDIQLGEGNYVGPYAYISGPAIFGDNNWVGAHVRIGAIPEVRSIDHLAVDSEISSPGIRIGNNVVIREAAQIHQGWKQPTIIGSNSFIMNQVYIAHDCFVGEHSTLASSVLLAGNVRIGNMANLGLGATVHQGKEVGTLAMVGMSSVITRDLPAFSKCYGSPARVVGINLVGLERAGFSEKQIDRITEIYNNNSDSRKLNDLLIQVIPSNPA